MRKKILKTIIFFCILFAGWKIVEGRLKLPKDVNWNAQGMEKVRENPGHYDLLISGTSMAITNVSAEELYLKYGIAGISIGEPAQPAFLSYYSVEEALNYQNPKLVLFDVQSLLYSDDLQKERISVDEEQTCHYTVDSIKDLSIKYAAVRQIKKLHEESSYWDYFSPMYHNHANWQNIKIGNFKELQSEDFILENKNLTEILENVSNDGYKTADDNTFEKIEISELNKLYLKKLADLCKEKNCELILIRGYGSKNWSWGDYNAILELAEELELDYLDLALYEKEIDFDWQTDSSDGKHHNILGTKKWTDFLGNYLTSKYALPDRRDDENYQEFELNKDKYENLIVAMEQKKKLISAINLNQYLDTLLNLEKEDIAIFIAISDEAGYSLTNVEQNILNAIGFQKDLREKKHYSYYAVMDSGKILDEDCSNDGGEIEGQLADGTDYRVASGGYNSNLTASIIINDKEQIQGGRGINIVVYNKQCKQVLSSAFFDTCEKENPQTARLKEMQIIQHEIEVNNWE